MVALLNEERSCHVGELRDLASVEGKQEAHPAIGKPLDRRIGRFLQDGLDEFDWVHHIPPVLASSVRCAKLAAKMIRPNAAGEYVGLCTRVRHIADT